MKKIAIIEYNPFGLGGIGRVLNEFANMMTDYYTVDIICLDRNVVVDRNKYGLKEKVNIITDKRVMEEFVPGVVNKGLRYINRKFLGIKNLRFLEYLYTDYSDFSNLIALCNQGNYTAIIGMQLRVSIILGKIADKLNCRTIGWQHNTYDAYFNMKGMYYWNQHQLASKYLGKLNGCIVLTDEDARLFNENLNVKARRIYNPNTIGNKQFIKKIQHGIKPILWVGRITIEQKGVDYLLDIAEKLRENCTNYQLTIVGDGPDFQYLKQEITNRKLLENVHCVGQTSNVEKYYEESSILISTSRWEGFGLTIVEAMAFGLPVIAFENSGPREIINSKDVGIIIPKYDTEKFAHKINELLQDEEQLMGMSYAAWRRSQDFNPDVISRDWKEEIDGKHSIGNSNC